jgi:hypothetical protein
VDPTVVKQGGFILICTGVGIAAGAVYQLGRVGSAILKFINNVNKKMEEHDEMWEAHKKRLLKHV